MIKEIQENAIKEADPYSKRTIGIDDYSKKIDGYRDKQEPETLCSILQYSSQLGIKSFAEINQKVEECSQKVAKNTQDLEADIKKVEQIHKQINESMKPIALQCLNSILNESAVYSEIIEMHQDIVLTTEAQSTQYSNLETIKARITKLDSYLKTLEMLSQETKKLTDKQIKDTKDAIGYVTIDQLYKNSLFFLKTYTNGKDKVTIPVRLEIKESQSVDHSNSPVDLKSAIKEQQKQLKELNKKLEPYYKLAREIKKLKGPKLQATTLRRDLYEQSSLNTITKSLKTIEQAIHNIITNSNNTLLKLLPEVKKLCRNEDSLVEYVIDLVLQNKALL